jgi:hypothetical protein
MKIFEIVIVGESKSFQIMNVKIISGSERTKTNLSQYTVGMLKALIRNCSTEDPSKWRRDQLKLWILRKFPNNYCDTTQIVPLEVEKEDFSFDDPMVNLDFVENDEDETEDADYVDNEETDEDTDEEYVEDK